MSSFITLIVDEKTSHLRELVVNQKSKRPRPRRNNSIGRSGNNHLLKSSNFKSRDYNHNNYKTEYSTSRYDYTTSRYEYITHTYKNTSPRYEYNSPRYDNSARVYEYSTPKYDYNARGYDHIKIKPFISKPIGTVTPNLKSFIENLCNTSGPEVSIIVLFTTLFIIIILLNIF